jgi:SAM-dependent methyltransferase
MTRAYIYLRKKRRPNGAETAWLFEESLKTFGSRGRGAVRVLDVEEPEGAEIRGLLEQGDAEVYVVGVANHAYYSLGWEEPLLKRLARQSMGLPAFADAEDPNQRVTLPYPYQTPRGLNEVARQLSEGVLPLTAPRVVAFVARREDLLPLPQVKVRDLPRHLKPYTSPGALVHLFGDYFAFSREDLLPYVPEDARVLLDIGCGQGELGRRLIAERGALVYGIEASAEAAEAAARRLTAVVCGDVEKMENPWNVSYDAILCADVLEHLFHPWNTLRKIAGWLKEGGALVASIPNVRHHSVVLDLFKHGRWDYVPAGLLCVSHVRFFTRSSVEDLFHGSGLRIERLEPRAEACSEETRRQIASAAASLGGIDRPEDLSAPAYYVVARRG